MPDGQPGKDGDLKPRPDPTVLTTEQLRRELASLRELLETRLAGMDRATELLADVVKSIPEDQNYRRDILREDVIARIDAADTKSAARHDTLRDLLSERIDAIDKATELLAATVGRAPSDTDKAVGGLRDLIGSRIDGIDRATKLLAEQVTKFPSDIDRSASNLREIIDGEIRNVSDVADQKFAAVDTRFLERDTRTEQAAQESRISLDAALAAAKEAVSEQNKANAQAIAKSEIATQKQIDANAAQNGTSIKAIEDKIADIKGRLDRGEGSSSGAAGSRTERRLDYGTILAAFAILVSLATVLVVAFKK